MDPPAHAASSAARTRAAPTPDPDVTTPAVAAGMLASVARHERRLTARTHGLTSMVWGLATAGIFATYAAIGARDGAGHASWPYAVAWVPWVLAGTALTGGLWHSHAVGLGRPPDARRGLVEAGLHILAFFAVLGLVLHGLATAFGHHAHMDLMVLAAVGLFAALLALLARRRGLPWLVQLACGLAAVAAAFLAAHLGVSAGVSATVAAVGGGLAYFVPGLAAYARG